MATDVVAVSRADERSETAARAVGWRPLIVTCVALTALFLALNAYMHAFALPFGADSTSPQFGLYWRSLLVVELVGVGVGTLTWWGWLVRSGRALAAPVTAAQEVGRIATLWGFVGGTSLVLYFMASFFVNADGAWHQTTVRDTAFTPPHIVMFYCAFPLGITLSVASYLYAFTRLPTIYSTAAGFPWSFFLLIGASITEMMQVGLNEFGHSLWITEEIFAAPLHWPFVTYGWLAFGIFAVWVETMVRLLSIEKELADRKRKKPGAAIG